MSAPRTTGTVGLADARTVVDAALAEAEAIGVPMNVAVVDGGGNLVHFQRQDGAWLGGTAVAIDKAFTARAFDTETGQLAHFTRPGGPAYGLHTSNGGRVVIYKGGFPLVRDGVVVGGVGVCGGHADQDEVVGRAAVAALADRTGPAR